MIGAAIRIVLPDETVVVPITARVAINFERQFKEGLIKAFREHERFEHLYFLAWEALKASGRVVKPFEEFVNQVVKVSFAPEADVIPLEATD